MPGPQGILGWLGLRSPAPTVPVDLASAGRIALAEARRLFALDIWDPPASDRRPIADRWRGEIGAMIAGDQGLGWHWEGRYPGDGAYEWCGAFAARCWAAAGLPLAIRRPFFASCYRLHRWATYQAIDERTPNPRPRTGPHRLCVALDEHSVRLPDGVVPQAGDILIVGDGRPAYGDHIAIVERFAGRAFHTIEGNAIGLGPDGKQRQGVVKATRMLGGSRPGEYIARWLIRPAPSDLVG